MRLDSGLSLQQEVGWDRATVRAARYLAQAQDQPFLVTSPQAVSLQRAKWSECFPTVWPTVQAGQGMELLSHLHQLGLGFTFTTKTELSSLNDQGCDLSTAVFSNSVKLGSHIRAAQASGVTTLYCDSVEELAKIKKFHPTARVILELGSESHLGELSSSPGAGSQDIPAILAEASRLELHMTGLALGLSCTGQEEELDAVVSALQRAREVIELAQSHGHIMSTLHLGRICMAGNTPSSTYTKDLTKALSIVADMAVQADASHWILAPSVTLVARIIAVRTRREPDQPIQYYINEGVFGAFSSVLAGDTVVPPLPLGGGRRRPGLMSGSTEAEIIGPSGDELDHVMEDVLLPTMDEGDWLLFPCMGRACLDEFGQEQRVEGSKHGGVRLRVEMVEVKGVLPVEMAWAPGTVIKTINVNLDLMEGKGGAEGDKELGELELGKTFMWEEDWCNM